MMIVKKMSYKISWHHQRCIIFITQVVHMIYHPEDVENPMKNQNGFGLLTVDRFNNTHIHMHAH